MLTPEKKIQNKIIKYLGELDKSGEPIFYERRQAGGYSYKKGIPDLYAVYNGIHIEIEVKRESGGEQSTMQEKFQERCEKRNIIYVLADSDREVKQVIERLKGEKV